MNSNGYAKLTGFLPRVVTGFLFMSAHGAGDGSLDARLKRRHAAKE